MDDCSEAIHRLYQFLDRELTEEDQHTVRTHLHRCPPCQELFRFEENVLTFIGETCRRTAAPPSLHDKVRKLCHD